MGAVVVEDGAGAVDNFLVALDLRHDLLLHRKRRQGDLEVFDVIAGHALQPTRAGHLGDGCFTKERVHDTEINPLRQDLTVASQDVELAGTKSDSVEQAASDACFAVLKTRRDFGEKDIVVFKVGVACRDFGQSLFVIWLERNAVLVEVSHWNE